MTGDIAGIFGAGPVIPVVQLDNEDDAVPMARALLAGGIKVVEITLRTPAALAASGSLALPPVICSGVVTESPPPSAL